MQLQNPNFYHQLMDHAVAQARIGFEEGGVPIGAALFDANGKLLGAGRNRRLQHNDPAMHAETDAFRRAGRRAHYQDAIMVTTLAPCWYCSGLIRQFRIPTVVVGERSSFAGGVDWLAEHGVDVIDLQRRDCEQMLQTFIQRQPAVWDEDIGVPPHSC